MKIEEAVERLNKLGYELDENTLGYMVYCHPEGHMARLPIDSIDKHPEEALKRGVVNLMKLKSIEVIYGDGD